VPGLETEMPVIYSEGVSRGRIPLQTFVAAFSTNPARIFGLYPQKGTIAVGSDADLVLFDPARAGVVDERRLHSRAGYDPFNGFALRGLLVLTLARARSSRATDNSRARSAAGDISCAIGATRAPSARTAVHYFS